MYVVYIQYLSGGGGRVISVCSVYTVPIGAGGRVISVWSVYTVPIGGGGACNQCMECIYSTYRGDV